MKCELVSDKEIYCKYGCGRPAVYTTPSGSICETHRNKCPAIRAKNSQNLKQAYKSGRRVSGEVLYSTLPVSTKDKMAWSRGKTVQNDSRVAKFVKTRAENLKSGKFILKLQGFAADDKKRWKRTKHLCRDSFNTEVLLESKNEIEFAELLNILNIKWTRPSFKNLSNGKRYTPDFFLPEYNIYCDPKSIFWINHFQSTQLKKIKLFEQEYKTKVIIFWDTDKTNWKNILLKLVGVEGLEPSIP